MELAKQTTSANYDSQISLMKSERDSWITDVYGFHIDGYEGSLENANSQYRAGQAAWSDEIQLFQQVELNWYLSARDVLQAAVGDPTNGEQQFQTNAMAQASSLQTLIGNSESNTSYLYNTAVGLWDSYQYAASGNLIDQAIANQQSQSSWNLQGAALSQSIADSFGRTEAYQTAQANAGLRINRLITSLLGEPAEIVDNAELASLQNGALSAGQASSFWSNGNAAGFDFTGRAADNQSTIDEYSAVRVDVTIASNLQSEMSDQESTFLNKAAEYFEKSERYLSLSATAESEGRFDEASYYMKLSSDQKGIASKLLNKGYNALGDTISAEVDSRGLNFTKSSFLEYKDSLLHKNFKNSTEIAKHIQSEKNSASGILNSGKTYDEIQTMLQAAKNLIVQGNDNHTAIESLLSYSQELAQRDIGGSLLVGLEDLISSLGSQIPKDISNASVTQAVANSQKEMEEKQSGVNELLHHMNSLVTNNNDLQALQALLQGGSQSMNLAANTAIAQYLDETTRKIGKENAERSANLQKELLDSLLNGDQYKYLRDAGYEFRVSGDSISGYRQIQSGDIAIDGNAMKAESYSPVLEFQYITIQTRFDPGNVSTTMLGDLNSTSFSANLVQNVRDSLSSMQEQMEKMFSEFQDKTAELQTLHAYNQQIQEYQENQFKEIKKNVVAAFQGLEPGFQKNFKPAMSGMKEYHTEASRYNFEEGSFGSQSSAMRSAFDGIRNAGGVYNGSRELKGSVNIKGIPVEVSYGMQDLLILSNFELGALDYDFNLKGTGTSFAQEQLTTVNVKYQTYVQDVQQRIEDQAKANDAEKESKGFIFTIMNGMNTGSGSMSERFTQSVQGELQSRVTGAVAEATGLPSSFVGALVGGSSMKDAFQAFQKQTITSEISKATGIPEWVISGQMDKMNQKKEEFYETQEFQMAVSVVAIVAAPFTGGASLAAAMAVNATIGAAQGAAGGGLEGALVGAVGGAVSGYVQSISGGSVNVGLSYSKENGFGASVSVGYGPAAVSVGVSEHGGATVGLGLQYKGLNAGLNYNSKTGSVDGNIGFSTEGGGSLALSYSEGSGVGFNAGLNSSKGIGANVGWSEKDGFGGGLSYGLPGEGKWSGTGANINWTQNGGTNIALTAGAGEKYGADGVSRGVVPGMNNAAKFGSGGTTAGTWSSEGGFQANKNFINDKWAQDYLADAEDRRQDQENHNQHAGADALSALGTRRREDEGSNVAIAHGEADVPNLLDSAFDAVGSAVSGAWGNAKSALGFGPDRVVMMPAMEGGYAENPSDRNLRVGEDAISNHLDKQRSEKPYLQKNELDVSLDPKYHTTLINMELEAGVSGGNLIRNEKTGKLYYRTEGLGADHTLIPTNPNERVKSPWKQTELHTDSSNGVQSGDYHAPKGSAHSVWGPDGGTFKITRIKTLELGGNEIRTETTINGVKIVEDHRHVMNQMPDVAYRAYEKGTPLPYGTPIGYTGITGNMAVSINNDKNSPRYGMLSAPAYHMYTKVDNAETHSGFIKGVTFGPEVRQSQGLPSFDYTSYYKKKLSDLFAGGK
ncbi:peptidase M23 [Leptospira sp. WS92.C1]